MEIGELLDQIRKYYLDRFADQVNENDNKYGLILEPAYRINDGEYATEGKLDLPCRSDLVLTENGETIKSLTIDTESMLSFEPIQFNWENDLSVSLKPFQWNYCICELTEGPSSSEWKALKAWYLKWFEEQPTDNGSFMHCIHFMSDPEKTEIGFKVDVDFGTAPVEALEEFLDSVGITGFKKVILGSGV